MGSRWEECTPDRRSRSEGKEGKMIEEFETEIPFYVSTYTSRETGTSGILDYTLSVDRVVEITPSR